MRFKPVEKPLLCKPVAEKLLEARILGKRTVEISLDLGRSTQAVELSGEGALVGGILVKWDELERVSERARDIYAVEGDGLKPVSIASRHFYKLVLVKWGAPPTLEIDGIHMHRVLDVTPAEDAEMKVRLLGGIRCRRVLDVCTGLGYTAITALRKGACKIVTIEKDENVLEIARLNPWSRELADDRVELKLGDAFEVVSEYDEAFDAVIHDPPRFSLSGELYSLEFYRRLAKALKPGGRIVHYVGQPGVHKGRKIWKGVLDRMRKAGFDVRYDEKTRCVHGYRKR